ncbi:hypothetical protein L3Q82_008028 [Scortum barcoo]|uniref:Uncharacterized protein n=1 Tax=Scortum barcoo TaxID=214431 RepID=A0ACB8WLI3_9TELE|nr:hypothetical protein L3Q82_008028 [Scortum barcoo]
MRGWWYYIQRERSHKGWQGADVTAAPAPVSETVPEAAGSVSALNTDINHPATAPPPDAADANPGSKVNSSLSNNTSAEREIPLTPESKKENDTSVASATEAVVSETMTMKLPPVPPSGSHAPTSLASTTSRPTHTVQAAITDRATAAQHTSTSSDAAVPVPDSTVPSNQSTQPKTHSSTSAPTPEPPKPETTNATATTTTQPSPTSSTSSSQEPPKSQTVTSAQKTSQPNGHPETATESHLKSTISSPSAQANAQADTPSQLTVGGDTKMVHESSTLDPLLAGLVSAFIITAVIITLLLFLKLRRRDNRPEFRRLQDLPMRCNSKLH